MRHQSRIDLEFVCISTSIAASMGSITTKTPLPICYLVTPVGNLGYGFDEGLLHEALERTSSTGVPTAIVLDSGSTDSGPGNLGLGKMTCPRSGYERDMGKLMEASRRFKVPVLISSTGGDGSNDHVQEIFDICTENTARLGSGDWDLNVLLIYGGVPKEIVTKRLANGLVSPCGTVSPATQLDVDGAPHIVAQMGPEPFTVAMTAEPDYNIVLGGRAYDPAPYIAFAIEALKRVSPDIDVYATPTILGGFVHMGKILECGGLCAKPKSAGAMAAVYADGAFVVTPLDPGARCTALSVAAHTFYEVSLAPLLFAHGV